MTQRIDSQREKKLLPDNGVESIQYPYLIDKEYRRIIQTLGEYHYYLDLVRKGIKWIDNGLRYNMEILKEPSNYKMRGEWLENSLGQLLDNMDRDYGLQVPFENYWIADGVIILKNKTFLRIEAKYVDKKYAASNWKYKNFLEWSTKYRERPLFFHPYTILYINYDFYKLLNREDFKLCYRNKMIIATFRTLERIVERIESSMDNKEVW